MDTDWGAYSCQNLSRFFFFLICLQCTCVACTSRSKPPSPSVCDLRAMADGRLARHSGKPLYSVAWQEVRCHHNICCRLEPPPAPVMHPVRPADLLPLATVAVAAATVGAAAPEKWTQRGTMRTVWGRMTEKIITVSDREIMSLLSCSYPMPLKHLIFAQLQICAALFMSSLFTCCWLD